MRTPELLHSVLAGNAQSGPHSGSAARWESRANLIKLFRQKGLSTTLLDNPSEPVRKFAEGQRSTAHEVIENNSVTVPLSAIPAARNSQSDPSRPSTRPLSQKTSMSDTPGTLTLPTSGSAGHHGLAVGIDGRLTCLYDRPAGGSKARFQSAHLRLGSDADE